MSTGAPTTLRERIGVDLGGRRRLEDGLAWAAAHGVYYVDMCLEGAPDHPNAPAAWTADDSAGGRTWCNHTPAPSACGSLRDRPMHNTKAVTLVATMLFGASAFAQSAWTTSATQKVRSALRSRLQQPIVVAYGKRRFTLHPATAKILCVANPFSTKRCCAQGARREPSVMTRRPRATRPSSAG